MQTTDVRVQPKTRTDVPYKRTLLVHLHEDKRKDHDGLAILEILVAVHGRPITLAFGEENVRNWQSSGDAKTNFYKRVKDLTERDEVEIAWRRSQSLDIEARTEYDMIARHFKKPVAYCPVERNDKKEESEKGIVLQCEIPRIIIPRVWSTPPYRRNGSQIEVIAVAPLHRTGFGPHRFIHADQIPAYADEVEEHCEKGLKALSAVEREIWAPGRLANRGRIAVNEITYKLWQVYNAMDK